MAKARKRRQAQVAGKKRALESATSTLANSPRPQPTAPIAASASERSVRRSARSTQAPNIQSLLTPALVMVGCWGLAFTFTFLSNEPNHVLYGGMAVLMAFLWTVSFGFRVRKLLKYRS